MRHIGYSCRWRKVLWFNIRNLRRLYDECTHPAEIFSSTTFPHARLPESDQAVKTDECRLSGDGTEKAA
jgi:hypothetical protein